MRATVSTTSSTGATAAEVETAITNVFSDAVVATRFHDAATTTINDKSGAAVELRIDIDNVGVVLPAAVKSLQFTSSFGDEIELLAGASAGAATRRAILNKGSNIEIPCAIASGLHVYVRSLTTNSISSGTVSINFLG